MQRTFEGALRRMPMVKVVIPFMCGIYLSNFYQLSNNILFSGIIIMICILIPVHYLAKQNYRLQNISSHLFFIACLFWGLASASNRLNYYTPLLNNTKYFIIARVDEMPVEKKKTVKTIISVQQIRNGEKWIRQKSKVLAYFAKDSISDDLKPGDLIIAQAYANEIESILSKGNYNYKTYLHDKQIYNRMYIPSYGWKMIQKSGFSFKLFTILLRDKIDDIYKSCKLPEAEQAVLSALLLGIRTQVSPEVLNNYSVTGAMHILAVSGLHIGILYIVLSWIFVFLRGKTKGILIIVIIWLYSFITGFSPSVERAAIMFSMITLAKEFKLYANIYNTLAASAMISLILNPLDMYDIGFQLSYLAVLGIVYCNSLAKHVFEPRNKIVKYFWEIVYVSLSAQLFTLPLTIYYFGQFPTYFLFTNLVAIPVSFIVMILGIAIIPFYFIYSKLFILTAKALGISLWLQNSSIATLANLPKASVNISFPIWGSIILFSIIGLFMYLIERKRLNA